MIMFYDIPEYENLYEINIFGTIRNKKTLKILSQNVNSDGYYKVTLYKKGHRKTCLVHRLVAKTFVPNEHNFPMVNHKDENKLNNYFDNLEWCDAKYNINYGKRNELSGKKHMKQVCHFIDDKIITYESIKEACMLEKLSRQTIRKRCTSPFIKEWYFKGGVYNG